MKLQIETNESHGMFKGKHTYNIVGFKFDSTDLSITITMTGTQHEIKIYNIVSFEITE